MPATARRLSDTPRLSFLIFASPKSGTTWLQRLLSSHPDVLCAESRAFGDYFASNPLSNPHLTLEKYIATLSRYYAPAVDGLRESDTDFYRHLLFNTIDTFAATSLIATGKRIYGEKLTPYRGTASHVVDVLHDYNPEVRFVNLLRDGRDVIVSGAAHWLNLRAAGAPDAEKPQYERALASRAIPESEFELFLDHWTDAAQAGLTARRLFAHVHDVRYEGFLADPIGSATALFRFIGADAGEAVVARAVESASFAAMSGGRSRGEEDPRSFFRKGVAGDWASWFTPEQRERFDARAGALMRQVGYA
jgi:hypothetical protein